MQFNKENLNFFKLLGLFILFGYPSVSKATHIVGGEMTYRFLYRQPNTNINVYQMTLRVYRDIFAFNENGRATPFDGYAFTLVHLKMPSGTYQRVNITSVEITSQRNLPRPEIPCSQTPKDVGYAEAIYSWSLFLPDTNGTYIVSYQLCCRNGTISNIGPPSPNTFSAVYSVEISPESQRLGNSSPVFTALPPPFVCEGDPMQVDLSATDADGDQIVYRFCNAFCDSPIIPPGNPPRPQMPPFGVVPFRPPYTVDAPMKGNPLIKLDANTGLITGTPDPIRPFFCYIYQQYVMTVCAEEYRNGRWDS
jgi:hypothetical protein